MKFCIFKSQSRSTSARAPRTAFWLVDNCPTTWFQGNLPYIRLHFLNLDRELLPFVKSCAALFCCRLAILSSSLGCSLPIIMLTYRLKIALRIVSWNRREALLLNTLPSLKTFKCKPQPLFNHYSFVKRLYWVWGVWTIKTSQYESYLRSGSSSNFTLDEPNCLSHVKFDVWLCRHKEQWHVFSRK